MTIGVKTVRRKIDGFHSWTQTEIAAFEDAHPIGTRARLAFALLLHTGQRRGDVIRLGWQHVREGRIPLTQGKTGASLAIPVHPGLRRILDATASGNMNF